MGTRSSKQKAEITTPVKDKKEDNKKVKRRKSKKEAANGGTIEEISIQEKKGDAEQIQNGQVLEGESKLPDAESSKKGETDSTGSGNAPTEIVEDSPDKENQKIAQLSDVQSPSEPSTSPIAAKTPEEKKSTEDVAVTLELAAANTKAETKIEPDAKPEPIVEIQQAPALVAEVAAKAESTPKPVVEIEQIAQSEPIVEKKEEVVVKPEPVVEPQSPTVAPTLPTETPEPVEATQEPVSAMPEPVLVEEKPEPVIAEAPPEKPVVDETSEETQVVVETVLEAPIVEAAQGEKVEAAPEKPVVVETSPKEPVVEVTPQEPVPVEATPEPVLVEATPEPIIEQSPLEVTTSELPVPSEIKPESVPVPEPKVEPIETVPEQELIVDVKSEEQVVKDEPEPIPEPASEIQSNPSPISETTPEAIAEVPIDSVPETVKEPEAVSDTVPESVEEKKCESVCDPEPADKLDHSGDVQISADEETQKRNSVNIIHTEVEINPQSPTEASHLVESERLNGHTVLQMNGIESDMQNGSPTQETEAIHNGQQATTENGPSETATLISWKHGGQEVAVCGDFCAWGDNCSMAENDGVFSTKIKLATGKHHIKFYVDGQWTIDENAPVVELEGHGQVNLLVVPVGTE